MPDSPNPSTLDIACFCGSLRKASFNRMALNLALQSAPASLAGTVLDWHEVPPYSADVQAAGFPASVLSLGERVARADGVFIAVPEYNFSVPGMFKNLLDWLSRLDPQPFAGKPVAMFSATNGPVGGARVQYELRRVLHSLNAHVMGKPEIFIGQVRTKFAADGTCTDEATKGFVTAQMVAFERWVRRCQAVDRLEG